MSWDAIGAIAEVFGALAVIVTLGYVGLQVRQNTKALQSATYESYASLNSSIQDVVIQNASTIATIYKKTELTDEEYILTRSIAHKIWGTMETVFLHHQNGVVPTNVFEARMDGFLSLMQEDHNLKKIWLAQKGVGYVSEFVEFVDDKINRIGA